MLSIQKRVFSGGLANASLFLFTLTQSVLLVPIFLSNWGKEKYGTWIAINAFFTLIKTIDLGHQTFIGNEITKYIHTDQKKSKEILSSALQVAYFIGFIELISGAFLLMYYGPIFWGIEKGDKNFLEAYLGTVCLLIVWMLVGSIGGIWARVLISTGNFTRATYWGLINKVLEILILLFVAFKNYSILTTCAFMAVFSFVFSVACTNDIKNNTLNFHDHKLYGNLKLGWRNFSKSIILTVSGFTEQFGNNIQIVSITSYLGKGLIPSFTTIKTITNIAIQVMTVFSGPLSIDFVRFFVKNEKEKMAELFSLMWFTALIFIYLPFTLLTPFVEKVYNIWTHNLLPFNQKLFYFLALSVCVISFGTPFKMLITGINQLKSITVISLTRFLCLLIIPFGISRFGIKIVGIAILLSEILASAIIPLIVMKKNLLNGKNGLHIRILILSLLPLLIISIQFLVLNFELFQKYKYVTALLFTSIIMIIASLHWTLLHRKSKKIILDKVYGMLKVVRLSNQK